MSKSDWSEIQAYTSLFAPLKCKIQFCKRISDSFWKDFSTRSSQLLNESLKEKAVQVPTQQSCQTPGAEHRSCPLTSCCTGGCIWAEMTKRLTLSSIQRERRKVCKWSRKLFPFRSEKPQIKAYFCYYPVSKNTPAIMSQRPLNNVL